jgi:hypothetical protein
MFVTVLEIHCWYYNAWQMEKNNSVVIFKRRTNKKIKFPAGDFVHTQRPNTYMKKE